jgi:hypothetical protein
MGDLEEDKRAWSPRSLTGVVHPGRRKLDSYLRAGGVTAALFAVLRILEGEIVENRKMGVAQHNEMVQVLKDINTSLDKLEKSSIRLEEITRGRK